MWTPTTRQQHSRIVTRYQTDLTDAEWRVIAPHLPKPNATGRPRNVRLRDQDHQRPMSALQTEPAEGRLGSRSAPPTCVEGTSEKGQGVRSGRSERASAPGVVSRHLRRYQA